MALHAIDALGDAITATKEYRPTGPAEWLWLALVTLLVGGVGISLPNGGSPGGVGTLNDAGDPGPADAPDVDPGAVFAEALVAVVAIVIVLWLGVTVLGAALEFPFLAWLRDGEADTAATVRAHLGQALGLAAFRVVAGLAGFAVTLALVISTVGTDGRLLEYAAAAAEFGPVLALVGLVTGVVTAFTTAFVIPTMLLEDVGVLGGWRRFWATLSDAPKQFLAYAVVVAVVAYVGVILVGLLALLALIPGLLVGGLLGVVAGVAAGAVAGIVVGAAVVALSVVIVGLAAYALLQVFLRYYALFVLGRIDGELDLATRRRRTIEGDSAGGDGPAAGPNDPQVGP
ncbi:hypothetical protein BRD02_07530 [Halobacteriales archaeon QS_8_69_73]|nr:MAG: hypothetical protein BRD02_07530 [Halobacteriales archaeon QS_8_69_73]